MKRNNSFAFRWVTVVVALLPAPAVVSAQAAPAKTPHVSRYVQGTPVDFTAVIPAPPVAASEAARADMAAVYAAQRTRTAADIAAAKADDAEEDIFVFADVLGSGFRADALPLTSALSAHVRNEAGTVTPALKTRFNRPRPFVADAGVHPVCEQKREPSYPSGHAMVGYLEALTLAQLMPARAAAILQRADTYASHRVVCGVHYPSDVQASKSAALVEFGVLLASPGFQQELRAVRGELDSRLQPHAATQTSLP